MGWDTAFKFIPESNQVSFCAECGGSLCRRAQKIWENKAGLLKITLWVYYDFETVGGGRFQEEWRTVKALCCGVQDKTEEPGSGQWVSSTVSHPRFCGSFINSRFQIIRQFSSNFQRYDLLKAHAEEKLEEANKEIDNISRGQVRLRFGWIGIYFLLFTGCRDCKTDGPAEEDRDESNEFGENGKTIHLQFQFFLTINVVALGWSEE